MAPHAFKLLERAASFRTALASLGILGGFGLAAWSFQVYQGAIDQQTQLSSSTYRTLAPAMLSIIIILTTALAVLAASVTTRPEVSAPASDFPTALLDYARRLSSEGRYRALLQLRANESLTLHILGRHSQRVELGWLALEAAAVLDAQADRAEVLIDDLGWAFFLLGKPADAKANITRGIEIATKLRKSSLELSPAHLRASVFEARGRRHLVLIEAADSATAIEGCLAALDDALELLSVHSQDDSDLIRRETAQLHHAYALGAAMHLRINKSGELSPTDTIGRQLAEEAIARLERAAGEFAVLGDDARLAKSLVLSARLHEGLREPIEAAEAAAQAEAAIRHSAWMEAGGIQDILGPKIQ